MDADALDALPRAYRVALRLRVLGADDALIADCLEIDAVAVASLLDIGSRKLARLKVEDAPARLLDPFGI